VRQLLADSVEKLQNWKRQFFRYQSKILKFKSESTVADSEIDQEHNVRKLVTPLGKKYETFCMRRKILTLTQKLSFSTLSAHDCRNASSRFT
jgi:hypothetical protein